MVDLLPQEIVVKKIYISRIAWLKYYIVAAVVFSVAAYLMIGGPKSFGGIDAFYFQVGLLVSGFGLVIGIDIRRLYHKYFITNNRLFSEYYRMYRILENQDLTQGKKYFISGLYSGLYINI